MIVGNMYVYIQKGKLYDHSYFRLKHNFYFYIKP